jgi:threonine efflux protein
MVTSASNWLATSGTFGITIMPPSTRKTSPTRHQKAFREVNAGTLCAETPRKEADIVSYLSVLLGIALIHFPVMVSPGPNFLLVTQTAVSQSRRAAVLTALGIATGAVLWSGMAAIGVGILLTKPGWLFRVLRILGGAYIVYIGIRMWLKKGKKILVSTEATSDHGSGLRVYRMGLFTNLTNPKSAVFFGSIFTALIGPSLPIWLRVAAVCIIGFNAVWWHVTLAFVFSGKRVQRIYTAIHKWVDWVAGGFLTFSGLRLIWESRA